MHKAMFLLFAFSIMLTAGCHMVNLRQPAYPDWVDLGGGYSHEQEIISGVGVAESAPEALYDALINLVHNHSGYYVTILHPRSTRTLGSISVGIGPLYIEETASLGSDTLYQSKGYIVYGSQENDSVKEIVTLYENFKEKATRKERSLSVDTNESYYRLDRHIIMERSSEDIDRPPLFTDIFTATKRNMTWDMFIHVLQQSDIQIEKYYGPISSQYQDEIYFGFRISTGTFMLHDRMKATLKERAQEEIRRHAEEMFREMDERVRLYEDRVKQSGEESPPDND